MAPAGDNPPTSLISLTIGSTFVNLSWSGASAPGGIASYWVYRNGVPIAIITSGTTYLDSTLSPLTAYTYAIRALAALALPGRSPKRFWRHVTATLHPGRGEGLREAADAYNRTT